MIELGNLKIEGFLSISNIEVPLNQKNLIWIKAPNGYGKSSILEAIPWALFGKTFKGKSDVSTWDWIRPKEYKGTKVEIFFSENENVYQVIRCSSYKSKVNGSQGKDQLMFFINGDEVSSKKKAEIQDGINRALGMTWDIFKNSVMFGQGAKRLIQETNSDKKKLFEEIFDIDWVNDAKNYAIGEWRRAQEEVNQSKSKLDNLTHSYEIAKKAQRSLKEYEDNFEATQKEEIKTLKMELKQYRVDKNELKEFKLCLATHDKELADIDKGISNLKSQSDSLQEKIQKFHRHGLHGVLSEIIILIRKSPKKAIKALTRVRDMMDEKDKIQLSIIKLGDDRKALTSKIQQTKSSINGIEYDLGKRITIKDRIKKIKEKKLDVKSDRYTEELEVFSEKVAKLNGLIEKSTKEMDEWQWVIQEPFGNKGIKSYIIESNLDTLNNVLERYSETIGFRVEFGIDLNTARKDFYALIERDGHVVDYDELSGGQKQLANISIAFAMHEIKGANILFLDEVFESLSKDNIEIICDLIDKMSHNRTIFMISHQQSLPLNNCKVFQLDYQSGLTILKK